MFFGVLIVTLDYVPILALNGIEGKMFHPMAVTVMLALGGALLLALTLMPVLCSFLLSGHIGEEESVFMRWAHAAYRPTLEFALRRRWSVVIAGVALFIVSILVFMRL